MTAAALIGRDFEPPAFLPAWLRPAAIACVVALHVAALSTLPFLAPKPPEPPIEVIVDVQPEAQPTAAPAVSPPEPIKALEAAPALPAVAPPVAEAPPVAMSPVAPPEPPAALPPEPPPPPPPAPVELAPPKIPPPLLRVEPPKPAPRPIQPGPTQAKLKPAPAQASKPAPVQTSKSAAAAPGEPAPTANAASQSAYVSAMAAAIRSRLFYPPAARARGAKGVVGVAFTIGASGALSSFAITRSSGDEDLDAAARTLVQSAHFPPPPGGPVRVSTGFNYVPR